jgi:hypothetical protein
MKVCFITPTKMLYKVALKSDTHLVLAHKYVTDREYARFYDMRSDFGDYVMLDNSAYELGTSVSVDILKKVSKTLKPSAIFLPDKRFDCKTTLELVEDSIDKFGNIGSEFFAVPQGSNLEEVLHCYDKLSELPIGGFGLYEEIGEVTKLGRRWDFLHYLEKTERVLEGKKYHMLGMEEDVQNISKLGEFKWATSIDSVKPIAYGLYGIKFHKTLGPLAKYPHRQKDYFETLETEFYDLVMHNCDQTQNWAQNYSD